MSQAISTRLIDEPLIAGDHDYASVTETVCRITERETTPHAWYIAFGIASSFTLLFFGLIGYLIATGVGVWGNNSPVFWAWPITNFVFWVGIGHAGTLISAILFLFRQDWRTSINRFAEVDKLATGFTPISGLIQRIERTPNVISAAIPSFMTQFIRYADFK